MTAYSSVLASTRRQALDQMQVLAGGLEVELRREVGDIDDQRVAFPPAARVAEPLPDGRRADAGCRRQGSCAASPAPGPRRRKSRPSRRLHDSPVAAEVGQHGAHAALRPCCGLPDRRCDSCDPCCRAAASPPVVATAVRTCRRRRPPPCSCTSRSVAAARAGTRAPAVPLRRLGVSGGIRPSGGSTMSDVRRPVGLTDWNTALYAPATSRSLPRSTRWSRRSSPARCLSSSARSSSVNDLLVGKLGGRWSGVW